MLLIPFDPSLDNQTFFTVLDGVRFQVDLRYNYRDSGWYLSLINPDGTRVIDGRRVNEANRLFAERRLDAQPAGILAAYPAGDLGTGPTLKQLGTGKQVELAYLTEADLA